jgi:hypothetical protein
MRSHDPRRHRRLNRVRTRTRRGGAMPEVWNAIRKDRAVLHRERPKIIGRGIVQLPPLGCEAECPSICKFSATNKWNAGIVQ